MDSAAFCTAKVTSLKGEKRVRRGNERWEVQIGKICQMYADLRDVLEGHAK